MIGHTIIGKTYVQFIFSTAWSAPYPIYEQLASDYPKFKFEVRYADEAIGSNCGKITWDGHTYKEYFEDDLPNAADFAKRLWATH